jgi:plasmid stability protein
MASLTIKKMPERLYRVLKQSAKRHNRSINREAIDGLEKTFGGSHIEPVSFLASVSAMRQRLNVPVLTEKILRKAKNAGRM